MTDSPASANPLASQVPLQPSKPFTSGAATTGSQRHRRFTDTFFDNHKHPTRFPRGRPFTGEREFTSGTDRESITAGFVSSDLQCGEYLCENPEQGQTQQERLDSLASVWTAPWLPTGGKKYMSFNYRRKTIQWEYVRFESDEQKGLDNYYLSAAKLAGANGWGEIEYGKTPRYQVVAILGAPSQMVRVAQAARAGDPWLLGFADTPNEELAKILGLNVRYIGGGRSGDAEYTAVQTSEPKPIVTPEQVLATPVSELSKMIAEAVQAAMDARDAQKKSEQQAKMAKVRASKGKAA